jgi:hypothetical protein
MVHAINSTLGASAVGALVLSISSQSLPRHSLRAAFASAQPIEENKQTGASDRVASVVTLRLSPQRDPASICRELLINTRAAEHRLASIATRGESMRGVSQTERGQAELAYGFVVIDDTVYEIGGIGCSSLGDASKPGSGTPN